MVRFKKSMFGFGQFSAVKPVSETPKPPASSGEGLVGVIIVIVPRPKPGNS